jgi:hypothetical protein
MPSNTDPFEAELAAALRRAGPPAPPYLTPVSPLVGEGSWGYEEAKAQRSAANR